MQWVCIEGCAIRMKMDSPLEEWLIKEAGIRASGEWISSCLRWIAANNPHHLSPVELQQAVLERWLTTDIAESSLPILPSDSFTTLTNMALQVNWVCDVSTSAYRQLQLLRGEDMEAREEEGGTPAAKRAKEQAARPSRMLLAEVTDGHSVMNAIEYQPMGSTLREDIPPGAKVQVLAAVCKKGTILLIPGCLRVLGGEVESMAAVNSLESVLNRALEQAKCHQKQLSGQLSGQPSGQLSGQPSGQLSGQLSGQPSGGSPKSASVPYKSGLMSPGQVRWGQRTDLPLRMQPPTSTSHAGNVEEHESANFTSLGGREANQHCSNQAGHEDTLGSPTLSPHSSWDTGATIPTRPVGHTPRPLPHEPQPHRSLSPQPHHRKRHSPGPHTHRPLPPGPHRPLPPGPHTRRSLSPGPHPNRPLPPPPRLHRHHSPGPHSHRPHSPRPHPNSYHSPGPHPYRSLPPGVHSGNHLTPWDSGGSLPSQPGPLLPPRPRVDGHRHAMQHRNGGSQWPKREFPWTSDHGPAHPRHSQGCHSSGPPQSGPPFSGANRQRW